MLQFLGMIYILLRIATILSMFTPREVKYPIKISFEKSPQIISSVQGIFIKSRKKTFAPSFYKKSPQENQSQSRLWLWLFEWKIATKKFGENLSRFYKKVAKWRKVFQRLFKKSAQQKKSPGDLKSRCTACH